MSDDNSACIFLSERRDMRENNITLSIFLAYSPPPQDSGAPFLLSPSSSVSCERSSAQCRTFVRIQRVLCFGENSKWRFVSSCNSAMDALWRFLLLVATTWWLVGSLIIGTAAMTNQDAYPGEFSRNIWNTFLPPTRFPNRLWPRRATQPLYISILSVAMPSALCSSWFLALMDEQNAN